MKKRMLASALIGAVAIAVTLILFFVISENPTSAQKTALGFLLAAEIIVPLGIICIELISSRTEKVVLNAGSMSLLALYFLSTLIVSLLFLFKIVKDTKWLVSLNVIICALTVIVFIVLIFTSMALKEKNTVVLQNVVKAKNTTDRIAVMKNNPDFKAYATQLEKIYEAARYADYASATLSDLEIEKKLDELESVLSLNNGEYPKVDNLTDTILMLYKKRAAEAKSLKQGSF